MDDRLREMAESRYRQKEFLAALFDLALEEQWFDLRHMVQHDMAKAIISDYSEEIGKGYLDTDVYYNNWEEVVRVGWQVFCEHTGLPIEKVNIKLKCLSESH